MHYNNCPEGLLCRAPQNIRLVRHVRSYDVRPDPFRNPLLNTLNKRKQFGGPKSL